MVNKVASNVFLHFFSLPRVRGDALSNNVDSSRVGEEKIKGGKSHDFFYEGF